MTTAQPVRSVDRLSASEVEDVLALAAAAERADGVYPLSEDVVLQVRHGGGVHLLAPGADGALAGYAHLGDESGELVVHPAARRRGHGTALLQAAGLQAAGLQAAGLQAAGLQAAGLQAAGDGPLSFWAHGDEPGARVFAESKGFERVRVLWQMRRPLIDPLPPDRFPEGVSVRRFRPGQDEKAWLDVNSRAFAHHPEQGRWTEHDLELREAEPWFDPAGFLLAVDIADTVLGFHWTKVHPAAGDQPAIGEIYVLGVDPGGHRKGLGSALSIAGLRHLQGQGLTAALLYVDESNTAAVALYRRLGFEVFSTDVAYRRPN